MAKLGISTGSSPNDGTGDNLIDGAIKINSNFDEIYSTIGDGSTLAVPVTSIVAGSNINVSGATGNVTITGLANTANVITDSLFVSGISTLGVITAASLETTSLNVIGDANASNFIGNLTGNSDTATFSTTSGVSTNSQGLTGTPNLVVGVVTAISFFGSGGNLTGIVSTANVITHNLFVSGISTLGVINAASLETTSLNVIGDANASNFIGNGSNLVDGKWNLGANGSTDYTFTGIGFTQPTNDPILYLARGRVYEFVNTMNAHPFQIRVSNGGAAYNVGLSTNTVSNGTLRFEISMDAPNTLYYQCTSHPGMGNTISVYPNTI